MVGDEHAVIERPTARIILFDPEGRVLLFRYCTTRVHDPALPADVVHPDTFWTTPGGGLLPGESYLDGARRELWEETGIDDAAFGDVVLRREKLVLVDGRPIRGREQYFVARAAGGEISLDHQEDLERADYRGHAWWSIAELATTAETIFPEGFAEIARGAFARVPQRRG